MQNCMLFLNVAKDYQLFLLTINSLMLLWGCKLVDHSVFATVQRACTTWYKRSRL